MEEKKRRLGTSAFVLVLGGFICKCLGALFRLPLTNLLGFEGIGVFQLIMSLYSFCLVLTCGGVTASLSKLISSARARQNYAKISTYLRRATLVCLLSGFAIGIVFFFAGKYIASFQGISSSSGYLLFVALLPLGAMLAVFRGFFQGYENMYPTAISQILEQVAKFGFGLLFASYFGKNGISSGVFGAFLGIVLSEVVALLFLIGVFLFKKGNLPKLQNLREIKFVSREFDKVNFMLLLSASILPLVNAFDGLVIVPRLVDAGFSSGLATKLFGLQSGIAGAFLNFPLIISVAVATAFLPNISYLISKGAKGKYLMEKGIRVLLLLVLPTTFGLVAISKQVLPIVYTDLSGKMLDVVFELMLFGAFSIIFTALMQYFVMLLQANGDFRFIVIITSIGGILKGLATVILAVISSVNVFAIVLGNILMSAFVCVCALVKLKSKFGLQFCFVELFLILFGTAVMAVTVYTFIQKNYFTVVVNIILGVILGVFVYIVFSAPVFYSIIKKKSGVFKTKRS